MGNYNFQLDLANAKETEKAAVKKLEKWLEIESVTFNDDYKYDFLIKLPASSRTYEVKEDLMCGQTGNTVIEYEYRGKPSGISTTEADFWIYKFDDGFYQISVDKLRKVISDQLYFREVTGGDKGSNTKMYLFRLATLKKKMQKL